MRRLLFSLARRRAANRLRRRVRGLLLDRMWFLRITAARLARTIGLPEEYVRCRVYGRQEMDLQDVALFFFACGSRLDLTLRRRRRWWPNTRKQKEPTK